MDVPAPVQPVSSRKDRAGSVDDGFRVIVEHVHTSTRRFAELENLSALKSRLTTRPPRPSSVIVEGIGSPSTVRRFTLQREGLPPKWAVQKQSSPCAS